MAASLTPTLAAASTGFEGRFSFVDDCADAMNLKQIYPMEFCCRIDTPGAMRPQCSSWVCRAQPRYKGRESRVEGNILRL